MVKAGKGILFLCATPIGNLEDASFRLLKTLGEVDIIAAEDTRTTRKILERYKIGALKVISYHQHSGEEKINYILSELAEGKNVGLVSEAGMPVIQDPGSHLVNKCIEKSIPVTIIPGPNAALSALALSGLPAENFLFIGFLPKTRGKRAGKLKELLFLPYTLIFYESPHRIEALLEEAAGIFDKRQAALVREITKIYEEVIRGSLEEIHAAIKGKGIKGEIVLIVEGYKKEQVKKFTEEDIRQELISLLKENISKKNALKIILSKYDIDRQKLYNISTKI